MNRRVLVTGISGFIAQQITVDLLQKGYAVRGTVRSLAKQDRLRSIFAQHTDASDRIEFVEADLERDEGWEVAADGVDYVQHVASPFPMAAPKNPDELIRPARDGTLRVLRAADAAGVKRTVLTSSIAAIAYGHTEPHEVLTEENWSDPENKRDCPPYPASKTIAERVAWDFINKKARGMELAVINPAGVFGPILSADVRTSVGIVAQFLRGKVPMVPDMGGQMVDVRDVSLAHIAAMEKPEAAGQRFAIAGDYLSLLDVSATLAEAFPAYTKKLPTKTIPNFVIRLLSSVSGDAKTASYEIGKRRIVSGDKAQTMLMGNPYISGREAIRQSAKTLLKYNAV